MFTGITTDLGRVLDVNAPRPGSDDRRIRIKTAFGMESVAIGASIACNGCCLTVVEKGADWFAVDVSNETMAKTTIGRWQADSRVNLERSLKLGDEMGGHLVLGHVDAVGRIDAVRDDGQSKRFTVSVPKEFARFIAQKGSVAIDGVSLTVNEVEDVRFGVNIIPHTQSVTTFGKLAAGDPVNVEIDLLARYVARLTETLPK
jgi:riboflavin synthase